MYLYCVRHTRLVDLPETVIGFKSARRAMAFGIGKAGSPMSEAVCYDKLRGLEKKGCIKLLGTERAGTRVRVFLPAEIEGVVPGGKEMVTLSLEEVDFFSAPERRAQILRESHRCFYCLREITEESYVIEHVVSRPAGDNSYRNVVAGCRQCNNRKGNAAADTFLRTLYREGLLTAAELTAALGRLVQLRDGLLKPVI